MPVNTKNSENMEVNSVTMLRYRKFLLILVIVLGVLLLGGFAIVAGTIISRLTTQTSNEEAQKSLHMRVNIPQAAQFIDMIPHRDRLILRFQVDGKPLLYILDIRNGALIRTIDMTPIQQKPITR